MLRPALVSTLLAVSGLAAACGGGGAGDGGRPNVLWIVLDTVRADRLGCYGGSVPTPALDALAAEGTRWARARSSAPWTLPSHASMFTGLEPHTHGAHAFLVERFAGVDNAWSLGEEHTTVAEVLRREGWVTGGIVANATYLKPASGLSQGFDDWIVDRVRGEAIGAAALGWIDDRESREPWLLFLNYMDAHRPYNVTPEPGERAYAPTESSSVLLDELYDAVLVRGEPPGELGTLVQEQYDRAVRNLDKALGALFDGLRERDLWDGTIVVVTSDHGEYFGEHGLVEHSKDVYEEALAVPLILKRAGGEGAGVVSDQPVSSAHLPRILLEAMGGSVATRNLPLFPLAPDAPVVAEIYYSRLKDVLHPGLGPRFHRVRQAYYAGDHKLVRSSDGRHELYDLAADPAEATNRIVEAASLAQEMLDELVAILEARPFAGSKREPVEGASHLNDLRETGYAGEDLDEDH